MSKAYPVKVYCQNCRNKSVIQVPYKKPILIHQFQAMGYLDGTRKVKERVTRRIPAGRRWLGLRKRYKHTVKTETREINIHKKIPCPKCGLENLVYQT